MNNKFFMIPTDFLDLDLELTDLIVLSVIYTYNTNAFNGVSEMKEGYKHISPTAIAELTATKKDTIYKLLKRLSNKKLIEKNKSGNYYITNSIECKQHLQVTYNNTLDEIKSEIVLALIQLEQRQHKGLTPNSIICKKLHISKSTLHKYIKTLTENNRISKELVYSKNINNNCSRYAIISNPTPLKQVTETAVKKVTPTVTVKPTKTKVKTIAEQKAEQKATELVALVNNHINIIKNEFSKIIPDYDAIGNNRNILIELSQELKELKEYITTQLFTIDGYKEYINNNNIKLN